MATVNVGVKSAFASKLNWGAFVALVLTVLNFFGVVVPPEIQASLNEGIAAALAIYVWIVKTWFTDTVTPTVASKL